MPRPCFLVWLALAGFLITAPLGTYNAMGRRMERILALDLGLTTGYAVSDIEDNLHDYGVILEDELGDHLMMLTVTHTFSYVVAEKPVIFRGDLGNRLQDVTMATHRLFQDKVKWIGPDAWKPTPFGHAEVPDGISTHTKDAIRIGLWYSNFLKRR